MPSSEKYLDFVISNMGGLPPTSRKMMGEYILYADEKIFGGIYDDRLLVKPVNAAKALLPQTELELPYAGAKPMLRITDEQIMEDGFLEKLVKAMLPELPKVAKKKK